MQRARNTMAALLAAAGWWLVSCRDVPAPEGGVFSISTLLLPSPGVVAGDTMRDSTGLVAPLRVVAYDVRGDTLYSVPVTFVILDTGAHLVGPLLVGEDAGTTVRVVGSVAALQTQPTSVKVTLSPDTLVAADSLRFERSSSSTTLNADLSVLVQHRSGTATTPVEAVIVRYSILRQPASTGGPAVVLMNTTTPSSADTTDATGRASRTLRLQIPNFVVSPLDSAIVDATAAYSGRVLGTARFTVVYKQQ
jgi:hypothetical protein